MERDSLGLGAGGRQPDIVLAFYWARQPERVAYCFGDAKRNATGNGVEYLKKSIGAMATYVAAFAEPLGARLDARAGGFAAAVMPVATLFAGAPGADLIVVGGYVHGRSGTLQGPHAETMIRSLNVRWAVLSAAGVNERGLFNSNLQTAAAEQAMIDAAEDVIAVIDSTKFGHQSLAHVCSLDRLTRLVVDDELHADWMQRLTAAGVQVTIAPRIDEMKPA